MVAPAGYANPRVFIGFGTDPTENLFILDVSLLDGGAVLAPDDAGWVDVSHLLEGEVDAPIHIVRGREGPLSDYETARCDVLFADRSGDLDPLNLDGSYVAAGATLVRIGRRLLVTVEVEGEAADVRFTGTITAYQPDYATKGWPTMKAEAEGLMPVLALYDQDTTEPEGEGEDSGARVDRLLDVVPIPAADREVDTGDSTLQATTHSQNLLAELRLVAASEQGALYEKRSGTLNYDSRKARINEARQREAQFEYGPPGYPGTLPYTTLEPALDKQRLKNELSIARTGGLAQYSEDATSKASYYPHREKRTDLLLQTDEEVVLWAEEFLLQYAQAEYRYDAVELDGYATSEEARPAMLAALLEREIRDHGTVTEVIDYAAGGVPYQREHTAHVFVERVEEWLGARAWRQRLGLSDASRFVGPFFVLDVSLLDGTDVLAPLW